MKLGAYKLRLAHFLWLRKETRAAPRYPLHETLYLDCQNPRDAKPNAAEGKDISTSGIRFSCESAFARGAPVDLTLHLYPAYEFAKSIRVRGHVVRCYKNPNQRHFRIACAFDHLEQDSHHEIKSFTLWLRDHHR